MSTRRSVGQGPVAPGSAVRNPAANGSGAPGSAARISAARTSAARGAVAPGSVVLVGGGTGAVDLMTVRARRALFSADVVVADRLGPTSVLGDLPKRVRVIDVGKRPGAHAVPQERINEILVAEAVAGNRVVRLKGGDPFLFGRGGEEVAACRARGIAVEVVPGVSSALAAPASACVPVTHRGTASALLVVQGHDELPELAVQAVVTRAATVAVLMGVARLAEHVEALLAAGAGAQTPVAIVEQATTEGERATFTTLGSLVQTCADVGVRSPAVVVLGDVADPALLGLDLHALDVPLTPETLADGAGVDTSAPSDARAYAPHVDAAAREAEVAYA
ncbi:uroporphyrin-III C-methyltransferase/precorrin-2 dehydrogenase/sirohydrochlorin ferrochelatase [Flavimobilis soli]|uniref:uroporphyrinogen-III C-methyltransferase n=1 Tax=Flavimobilis soli TaxID=442709 RepID=A0A2A9EDZ9_9MICO|nr:uroporphyrinogen-III C-methyltransferase [Flavimobilis soli]PFG37144.1 uroporphyrin-III C-methyltransferase/precorrin-2 dehydrogenase/sirohydrochlorin ferrochelatase [Flavimobilis soli]